MKTPNLAFTIKKGIKTFPDNQKLKMVTNGKQVKRVDHFITY